MTLKVRSLLVLLFTLFISTSCFSQDTIANDSLIKRAIAKLIVQKLPADHKTGSAFSLIHFTSNNGKTEILDYKSSNTEFEKALETLFKTNGFDLQLSLPHGKKYLAIIIYTAENGESGELLFTNNTFYSMQSLSEIKLSPNTVVLSPIFAITYEPIR